jgi:imidazolonepropionase-like amidohydrolase
VQQQFSPAVTCGDGRDGAFDRQADYRADDLAEVIDAALRRHLAAGVTTMRDLGDRQWSVLERRDRPNDGTADVTSPTILASGPPITSIRGHCWQMGGEAQDAATLRAAIRERAEHRVDVVKIMVSGGVTTAGTDPLACQFSRDDVRLMVDEAHAAALPVTVHAHGLPAVEQAIEAGVDGIEHCACLTPTGMDMRDSLLESFAQRRIAVCPTVGTAPDALPSSAELAFFQRLNLTGAECAGGGGTGAPGRCPGHRRNGRRDRFL